MPMRNQTERCVSVAFLCALFMLASPAQAEDSVFEPFRWTDVDFTPDCSPNAGFQRVLRFIGGQHPNPKVETPIDTPLVNAISGDTTEELMLDNPQPWNGLNLTGLAAASGIERGPAAYSLHFSDNISKVREIFNKRGWKIPPGETGREVMENYASIGLHEEAGGGTSVNCSRD